MGSASTACDGLSWIHCWQPLGTTHPNAFFCHMFTFHQETIEVGTFSWSIKILCHLTEKYGVSSQGTNTTAGTGKIKVQVNKKSLDRVRASEPCEPCESYKRAMRAMRAMAASHASHLKTYLHER